MSAIGIMAFSIFHDMRHLLSAIYANAEFLERHDICASVRADLLLEIQEAVLATTERIDSLLQFGGSGRNNPLVRERVSLVVQKAVAAVKFHPDGRNVSITVGKFRRRKQTSMQGILKVPYITCCSMLTKLRHAQVTCLR
jgi:light-regulated signal transduction histidine kinase (bacteriophytochrome)